MPTNIEIKARVRDFHRLQGLAEDLSDTPCEVIEQEDTFFHTPMGRLKLRVLGPGLGQLIYYERGDTSGPTRSDYIVSRTSEPASLKAALSGALEVRGTVHKRRLLYWVGNTRVHLDEVEGLGSYMELEVVLDVGQTVAQGERIAAELMEKLGVSKADLVQGAYIDLIESQAAGSLSWGQADVE